MMILRTVAACPARLGQMVKVPAWKAPDTSRAVPEAE
jgi:hypothetical protein